MGSERKGKCEGIIAGGITAAGITAGMATLSGMMKVAAVWVSGLSSAKVVCPCAQRFDPHCVDDDDDDDIVVVDREMKVMVSCGTG